MPGARSQGGAGIGRGTSHHDEGSVAVREARGHRGAGAGTARRLRPDGDRAAEVSSFLGNVDAVGREPAGRRSRSAWRSRTSTARPPVRSTSTMAPQPSGDHRHQQGGRRIWCMKFAGDFQGMPFNAKITLVPEGTDKAKVVLRHHGRRVRHGRHRRQEVAASSPRGWAASRVARRPQSLPATRFCS